VRVLGDWEFQANDHGQACLLFPPNGFMRSKCRALIDHLATALRRQD
jgi:hypothetical protein